MIMKRIGLFLIPFLLLGACKKDAPQTPTQADQSIVAQVGNLTITQNELDAKTALLPPEDLAFVQTPIGRQNFLHILVREKLAELSAKDAGLAKSDEYLGALEDKRQHLEENYSAFAEDLLRRMWYDYLKDKGLLSISDEEIEAYFKKYPYEMTLKQIIIADAQTADEVFRALRNSKSRWNEFERQYSAAPENLRGQTITFMPGEFISEIEVVSANSAVGTVQGFIKTAQGFHIIMKTGERKLKLSDAAPRIREVLENQKIDAVLNGLQNKYKVVIYEKN